MNTEHLQKRKNVWFVRVVIPPHLREQLGKRELIRTLKTGDPTVANRRKHQVLADIQAMIAQAEMSREIPRESSEYVLQAARELRAGVLAGQDAEEAGMALDATIERHLDDLRQQHLKKHGKPMREDEDGNPLVGAAHENVLRLAHKELTGEQLALLSIQVKRYLNEIRGSLRNQTVLEKVRAFDEFRAWLQHDVEVTTITRKVAGQYLTEKLMLKEVSALTKKGTLSHLSSLWTWMEGRGLVDSNPWARLSGTLTVSKRGKQAPRRPWTDEELLKLLKATPKDDPLFPLTALAVYTGMRREEVCLLRKADVQGQAFTVREGKTSAAVRTVPIHPIIRPMVARLVKTTTDDYLLPGLLTGGLDAKRGHLLGKRFGHFIRTAGFMDKALCFHTFRNTFINRCEVAGVPVSTVKLIVGHDREDLTYGGYSPGVNLPELTKAVSKVTYGALDAYLKGAASAVEVNANKSHRRPKTQRPLAK